MRFVTHANLGLHPGGFHGGYSMCGLGGNCTNYRKKITCPECLEIIRKKEAKNRWQLVILCNEGVHNLPWGNEEWRLFGPEHKSKKEILASLKVARQCFADLKFSYRKVKCKR